MVTIVRPGHKGREYFNSNNGQFKVVVENGELKAFQKFTNENAPTYSHLGCEVQEVAYDEVKDKLDSRTIKCIDYHLYMQQPQKKKIDEWKGEGYYQFVIGQEYDLQYLGRNHELASELNEDGVTNIWVKENQLV